MTGIPTKVRQIVLTRADGHCERCGVEAPLELHHRKFRSRGGAHTASNLVALCGWGNHTGCHGWAHTQSIAAVLGWSLHAWNNPNEYPIHNWRFPDGRKGSALLQDDGAVDDVSEETRIRAEYQQAKNRAES